MSGNLLDSHQVLARWDLGGELEGELLLMPRQPCRISRRARLMSKLVDFEPVTRAIVVTNIAGCFREINLIKGSYYNEEIC